MDAPGLQLEYIVGTADDLVAESGFVAQRLHDLASAPPKSIAVLGWHMCETVNDYQFDIALRTAAGRGVVAVLITDPNSGPVSSTALDTARRFGIAVLRQTTPVNLATVVAAVEASLRGSAELALRRAVEAFHRIPAGDVDTEALVAEVASVVAADIAVEPAPAGDLAFPIALGEEPDHWLVVRDESASSRPELLLVGKVLANTLAVAAYTARHAEEIPIRSRAELLTEILDSGPDGRSELLRRARSSGLPIDRWHIVVRFELDNNDELWSEEVASFEARQLLGRTMLDAVRTTGGTWHLANTERSLLLISMHRNDPAPSVVADVLKAANRALQAALHRVPQAIMYCGVGTAHSGCNGLINSAAEARAAQAMSRTRNRPNVATAFDSLGLRRALVEWYASSTAREAIATVLAPLDRMGTSKADSAIQTLQVYLDNHGSLSKTAAALHLHRNTVAYRIDRIFEELDVDPGNPDDWLLLQLACRAHGLT